MKLRRGGCKGSQSAIPKCWSGGRRKLNAFRLSPASSGAPPSTNSERRSLSTGLPSADGWHEIEPSEIVRESAMRFLGVHPLRAADALQLGAAFAAAEGRPASLRLVTLDESLADAARKEGFALIDSTAI